ncbi:MAG: FecR domain-containing protein [Acidobacteriaceae bacterium]|nr:FecR domain-containing protein [Acidobacteriaceae bacterium]MBV9781070.1 FecR domain-containing protein [Acidobacteriaceae bacterium]
MYRNVIGALIAAFSVFTVSNLRAQTEAPSDQTQSYPQAQQYPQSQPQYEAGQPPQQDPSQAGDAQLSNEDKQHGVARLSIVQGDVNVKRGDSGDLVAAAINAPLVTQDHVQTSPGSRAEVQFDYANVARLAPDTDLGLADLEYQRYQVQLGAGTIIWRVLRDSNAQAEIDTPSIAVRPVQQGDYRISVLQDGSTQITVRSGELEVYSPRGTERLQAGRTMLVRGDSSDPEFQTVSEIARDQFDDWSDNRDRQLLASQSYQHVSRDIYGADDLDAYGNWVPSQYGQVWEPNNPGADWAPYSNGQWAWEPYYGWTWVDADPWGWAPFHYGRWFWNTGYGWCWWPGSIFSSYWWNPALVGFFGWGGGFGFGWGGLGWVALGPFEFFHHWWGHGWHDRYGYNGYRNASMYRNAAVRGAAITAAANSFGRGRTTFGRATAAQLRGATALRGQLPVNPVRASRQFSNRPATANPRLASAANRQFFQSQRAPQTARTLAGQTQMHSPAASRQGIGSAQRGSAGGVSRSVMPSLAQNSLATGSRINSAQQNLHGVPPNMRAQAAVRGNYGASAQTSGNGWHRFGEPGTANGFRGSSTPAEHSGWHSFGQPQHPSAGNYGESRTGGFQGSPGYGRSFSGPNYNGNYQSRPLGSSQGTRAPQSSFGYRGGYNAPPTVPHYSGPSTQHYSAPSMPHYNAPSTPHYSMPSAPHFSAPHEGGGTPSFHGGGSSFHGSGGGGSFHGGGGSHSGGGGGHSSGGHHR